MLKLKNIEKIYSAGDFEVHALKNVSLEFRESEMVAILGPSGCGKTTMLNIIGGLDKYTQGDLVINGISTKQYKDSDWDAYRNSTIGFVFQSYNLISHLTVLENVELALSLSGVGAAERRERAKKALTEVGLETQFNKKPNQLSGGQMQRVAIARALVNNPDIILADEPTGALDSTTSVQIMELLKEVSKTRLVIMVTHNAELANRYADRIIKLADGEVVSDSNPIDNAKVEENIQKRPKKTAMSFFTAFNLSLKNLFTKKVRAFITSFAGSIGIVGVALILALSTGFNAYIDKMQTDTLSSFPLTIASSSTDLTSLLEIMQLPSDEKYPEVEEVYVNKVMDAMQNMTKQNEITKEYVDNVIKTIDKDLYYDIIYSYGTSLNIYSSQTIDFSIMGVPVKGHMRIGSNWVQIVDNQEFINSQYDVLKGHLPTKKDELVLVVDEFNQITDMEFLQNLGIDTGDRTSYSFDELMGMEFKLLSNDLSYTKYPGRNYFINEVVSTNAYADDSNLTLKIVGIVRVNEDTTIGSIKSTVGYHSSLSEYAMNMAKTETSTIVEWQKANPQTNCLTGSLYEDEARKNLSTSSSDEEIQAEAQRLYQKTLAYLGLGEVPTSISIYPKDFESKEMIKDHLTAYNDSIDETDPTETRTKVYYSDMMGLMVESMNVLVNAISYVLIAFTSISLVVSSIMIGVITYVSVLERTKEIGILKSIGARKKDISRVFNAETLIIGFVAGFLGVVITYLLSIPLNILLTSLSTINGLVYFKPTHALILVAISMFLTFIAGLVPSRIAAKKDAVVALRTE